MLRSDVRKELMGIKSPVARNLADVSRLLLFVLTLPIVSLQRNESLCSEKKSCRCEGLGTLCKPGVCLDDDAERH